MHLKLIDTKVFSTGAMVHIIMYDKVAALGLLGRHLGLFGSVSRGNVDREAEEEASRDRMSTLVERIMSGDLSRAGGVQ
jgi:hypothetical protein